MKKERKEQTHQYFKHMSKIVQKKGTMRRQATAALEMMKPKFFDLSEQNARRERK